MNTKSPKSIWWRHDLNNSKPPLFGNAKMEIKNASVLVFFVKPITP